jgi:hypothetical protein
MSTISAGTTSGTALVNSGDTTGQLVLQTNGTTTAVTIGTNQVVTLAQPLPVASGGTGATSLAAAGILTTGAAVTVAQGGTGSTSLTANNVLLGNGTSAVQAVAPGTNGNVLTSNGTTWTSAAPSGSGGATQVGSVCLNNTTNLLYYAANPAAQTAAPFFSSANFVSLNSGWTSYTAFLPPKYSTYYGGWFTWGLVGGTYPSNGWVFFSTNGLNWIPFVYGPNTSFALQVCNDGTAAIAVDETNGRIFIAARETVSSTSGVYYSSAPATQNNNTWTYSGFDDNGIVYGESPAINSMEWVQFTSTTANGAIVFCSGLVNDGTARVYTIAAGATTGTLRVTYTPSTGVNSGWMVWNKTFQRIAVFHGGSTGVRYSATNSFASWSNSTMPAAANSGPGSAAMSGSRLACVTSSSNVRYTSDFSTWSTETAPQTLNAIWHNGTSWVGVRENSTGDTGGIYYTNNTNPTSWVRAVGGFFKTGTGVALRSN